MGDWHQGKPPENSEWPYYWQAGGSNYLPRWRHMSLHEARNYSGTSPQLRQRIIEQLGQIEQNRQKAKIQETTAKREEHQREYGKSNFEERNFRRLKGATIILPISAATYVYTDLQSKLLKLPLPQNLDFIAQALSQGTRILTFGTIAVTAFTWDHLAKKGEYVGQQNIPSYPEYVSTKLNDFIEALEELTEDQTESTESPAQAITDKPDTATSIKVDNLGSHEAIDHPNSETNASVNAMDGLNRPLSPPQSDPWRGRTGYGAIPGRYRELYEK